jgi:hypothetical protein
MCDINLTTGCVLGTDYFPLYLAISIIPNTWDGSFSSASYPVPGEFILEVKAGTWAKI